MQIEFYQVILTGVYGATHAFYCSECVVEDTGRVEFKRGTVDGSASKIVRTADTRGVRRIETGANFIRRALLESPHWGPANHMLENSAVVPDNPDQT